MKKLPKGHILHKGKIYVRTFYAGKILGVYSSTIADWFRDDRIPGVLLPAKFGEKKVLFVLKSALTTKLFEFTCDECGRKALSKVIKRRWKHIFCSSKCSDRWWNRNAPVRYGVRRKLIVPV